MLRLGKWEAWGQFDGQQVRLIIYNEDVRLMVTTRRIKNKQQIQYADVKLEEPIPVLLQDFAGKRRVRAVQSHDGHWVGYVDRQASSVADLKVGMTFWNTNKMRPEKINKITETDPIRKRIHLDTDMSKVITSGLDSVYIVV